MRDLNISHFCKKIILGLLLMALGFAQTTSVTGTGMGLSKDAAIEQAKRDAVEQGLGAVIASETIVKNAAVFSDNIYSKAQGFVKSFEVVSAKTDSDGLWTVEIRAEITAILDEILKNEVALQTLLNSLNRPKIIFLIREENLIDNTTTDFAETRLLSMFYEKGFDVVDRQLVAALKGEPDYANALSGNVAAAGRIAGMLGAEVIVIGTAKISSGGQFYNMYSGQADINGKIVRADTGEILAVVPQARGKKAHISATTAGVNAANEAAEVLGKAIIKQLIQKWSTQQANFAKVFVVLKNADFGSYMMFESFLKAQTVPGIRNAYSKSLNDGVAEYEVEFEGKAQDLAMGLSRTAPEGFNFKIVGLSGNRITAEIIQ